ncbi:MAG: glutamate--tRNA ligase [Cyanobacteria bacterium HKST-UBA04]|nr:glutamate--tRNA ligase [Cyanobacteria bacterium HKST-UBA04]MCA9840845.1 glutamate--tRNA ligase [Cyanobacteria bacterium HKST-UBA03]
MSVPVRVRIAPSPTGNLHVGTARTALFNYLYAKGHQGQFILRIEDTDRQRSEEQYVDDIFKGLKSLGLHWDEGPDCGGQYGPYRQSERFDLYPQYAQQLIDKGLAYPCYLTQDELEAEKEQAKAQKRPYVYSGKCRDPRVREELAKDASRKPSLRFRLPDNPGTLTFHDEVRGELSFDLALLGDFVIMKNDGTPTYNFAVVVDDMTMGITHVIRGEDHISNTPRQLLLYEALGASPPVFAHVGMILAPDRSKLSKRHGATAVAEFVDQGYLPEAFCNFLSLMGWSPPDGQEVGSLEQFAAQFGFDRLAQSPAVFDIDKLKWLNGQYIRQLPLEDLWVRCQPYLSAYDVSRYDQGRLLMMLEAVREPLTVLSDITEDVAYFFEDHPKLSEQSQQVFTEADTKRVLEAFQSDFLASARFDTPEALAEDLKTLTHTLTSEAGLKTKTVMWAIRSALTGRVRGADLSITLYILGKDAIASRVDYALSHHLAQALPKP